MTIRTLFAAAVCLTLSAVAPADDKKEEKKDAPVAGTFTGNGKEAKLAFASSFKDELDKEDVVLVFTEKDPSKEKNPKTAAMFNKCGSALIVIINPKGKVIGCQVCHEGNKQPGFNDIGRLELNDYKTADGKLTGTLTTKGELTTFGERWEVKLTFSVAKP